MEHVQLQTAQNVAIEVEVAGLGDRMIAALIDYAILACYLLSAGAVVAGFLGGSTALFVALYLPAFLYFLLCEVFMEGQSIGKRWRKLRVARLDGAEPGLGGYLIRWLLRPVDVSLTGGLVGMVCIFATGRGQRLGDLAAGTAVLKVRPRVNLRDTLFTRLDETHTPTFPQAERLAADDIATAKAVLDTFVTDGRSSTTHRLGLQLKAALEQKMNVSSSLPPADFLRAVVQDYNHVRGRV